VIGGRFISLATFVLVLAAACLLGGLGQLAAKESCGEGIGTVCLDAIESERTVTILAENRETYEVTVTVNVAVQNMTPSTPIPYTRTLNGHFKGALLTLTANTGRAWSYRYNFHWTPGASEATHDDAVVYDLPYDGTHVVIQGFHGAFSHTDDFEYAVDWGIYARRSCRQSRRPR
jgi:hypothetical protein